MNTLQLGIFKSILNLSNRRLLNIPIEKLHATTALQAWTSHESGPKKWLKYNEIVYPPQGAEEERRPAFVCHQRENIKYSPKKMWYIASLVRGMTVDKAIEQLKFVSKKGAKDVREVIEEAVQLAAKEHNVEFPREMWVAESFVGKGVVIKGMRRHARMRAGEIRYFHCHYFVRLEEGKPPKEYYQTPSKEPQKMLENWLTNIRARKITNSL
ncbi:hypothetical protein WA026_014031 [Henosepilachna vigintioctopunctata]|uniref:Large ribosomal subunit protein uL22m n=1 Tax=Henosepilachna vigintioctopunctata TaxID=420089 RepID=A0AAW1TYH7_9CUCU